MHSYVHLHALSTQCAIVMQHVSCAHGIPRERAIARLHNNQQLKSSCVCVAPDTEKLHTRICCRTKMCQPTKRHQQQQQQRSRVLQPRMEKNKFGQH